ncbi:Aerotaxis sensor receptor protein, partial [hydrothermal vent metagenome]
MKKNLPVNDHEINFPEQAQIISTTDLKGAINYFNQSFLDISGFSYEELQGKNHNVIRHPDMPPAAFQDLWDTLKQGGSWMGIVKNRCKNGDYYWVDAYVTPVYSGGQVTGYQSVRTRPDRKNVNRAHALYQQILSGKKSWFSWLTGKVINKLLLSHLLSAIFALTGFVLIQQQSELSSTGEWLAVFAISLGLSFIFARWHAAPWQKAAKQARQVFDNDIACRVYTGRNDELGYLQCTIAALQARLNTVLTRVDDSNSSLVKTATQTDDVLQTVQQGAQQQQSELEQLATALEEMTATVREVATSAVTTSEQIHAARDSAQHGSLGAVEVLGAMDVMMSKITDTVEVIQILESNS